MSELEVIKSEIKALQDQKKKLIEDIDKLEAYQAKIQVEGKVRLQCGTDMMLNPQFHLVLPSNIDLTQQNRGMRTTLSGVRIVAYIYATEGNGSYQVMRDRDERGVPTIRNVELYNHNNQNFRLD